MSKRKQVHTPITYKENPPLWQTMPVKGVKKEPPKQKKPKMELEPETVYEEILIVEAEEEENNQQEHFEREEAVEVVRVYDKEKTRDFVQKEMNKLMKTLDDLISDYEEHTYAVNFVLEVSGQAKKKLWELQGYLGK